MTAPIPALIGAVRRRLWLEALCARERRAAWASAAVVLAGAGWRLAVGGRSVPATATVALVVLVVPAMLALLAGPPPGTDAARRIDAWFGGRELMTSAWDQLARPPAARAGAADFVVARAAEAAIRWHAELARRPRRLGLRRLAAPLALLLAGAFLHLLPGRAPAPRPGDAGERSAPAPAADVLAWRPPAPAAPAVGRPGAPAGAEERDAPFGDDSPAAPRAAASGGGGGTGPLPGTSAPAERLDVGGPGARLPTSFVDVPRAGGRDGAGTSAAALDAAAPDVPPRVSAAAPRAATAALDARADLAPALRAYVAAYLAQVGEAP